MKNNLSIFAILLTSVSIFAQKTIQRTIYFESANAQLSTASQSYLMALADTLKKYPTYSILLIGHTDATGTAAENQSLSEKRALIVKTELGKYGVPAAFMALKAMGTSEPLSNNTTLEGKKRNRRVEIAITFSPPNTSNTTAVAPPKKYQNMMQLYRDLSLNFQNFKINTAKDTIIRGEKGTVLFISKASFEGAPANVTIDFRLKEAYSFSDIISENLSTQSGNKLLQTGGMIYVDAKYKGVDLTLKKEMNVSFSSKESREEGMQLFRGERDSKNNGKINWIPIEGTERISDDITIYTGKQGFNPYVLTNKNKILTFKEIIDTSSCQTLLSREAMNKVVIDSLVQTNISNTCLAMSMYHLSNPAVERKSIRESHIRTFKDLYQFYKATSYEELIKNDGKEWNTLMQTRLKWIQNYEAEEHRKDSIQKAQIFFQNSFPLPEFGWVNCDKFMTIPKNDTPVAITVKNIDSKVMNKVIIIFRKDKIAREENLNGTNIKFSNLVRDVDVLIVGMKISEGQPYLAVHAMKTNDLEVNLDYKSFSTEELKLKLKELDKYWINSTKL